MTITVDAELESVLKLHAERLGISPEQFGIDTLRRQLLAADLSPPQNEWHRRLREAASDCGVSLPDAALTAEGIYE